MKLLLSLSAAAVVLAACATENPQLAQADCKSAPITTRGVAGVDGPLGTSTHLDQRSSAPRSTAASSTRGRGSRTTTSRTRCATATAPTRRLPGSLFLGDTLHDPGLLRTRELADAPDRR